MTLLTLFHYQTVNNIVLMKQPKINVLDLIPSIMSALHISHNFPLLDSASKQPHFLHFLSIANPYLSFFLLVII